MDKLTVFFIGFLFLALAASLASVIARLRHLQRERQMFAQHAANAEARAQDADRQLAAVVGLNRLIGEAQEEKDVIDSLLRASMELVGGVGASFVPLDERGQPLAAICLGDLPATNFEPWVEYLASPAVRQRCASCKNHEILVHECPLLQTYLLETDELNQLPALAPVKGPLTPPAGVYCLPVRWSGREFGVMNVYLPEGSEPDTSAQPFLQTLVEAAALVIESVRLRHREVSAVNQLQALRERTDLNELLCGFLDNLRASLPADFVLLLVRDERSGKSFTRLASGDLPAPARAFIDNIAQGVFKVAEPLLLGDVAIKPVSAESLRSLIAAPLRVEAGKVLGVILAGNAHPLSFNQRQLDLLGSEASQAALVVHNTNLMAQIEYSTMISERTRLAREIHDGLAQTLGFLKLHTAQMQNSLEQNDFERLRESLQTAYRILSEAYNETRLTIDNLRIAPASEGLVAWLRQTAEEFEEASGLPVELAEDEVAGALPLEIQAQLIRIVQEALSNIRKHAQAAHVWISVSTNENDLVVEIRDDGRGFSPEDVPGPSRYGLQGMRERSELIGADFQVISGNQSGTIVSLRLPMTLEERAR